MLSWPHFFQADPALLEDVDGLHPEQDKHQFVIDLVPVSSHSFTHNTDNFW